MENVLYNNLYDTFQQNLEKLAVVDEDKKLTRQEFLEAVDALSSLLKDKKRVAIIMHHKAEMILSMFAALKAGAAYIPIEPTFPKERIEYILKDCNVDAILTDDPKRFEDKAPLVIDVRYEDLKNRTAEKTGTSAKPDDLAYILYTSGSTGKPKGVAVTNHNVCHYARAFNNEFKVQPQDRMLQHSVCSFDIFTEEVFGSLLNGGTLYIPSEKTKADFNKLLQYIDDNQITILSGFPYLIQEFNETRLPSSLRLMISGGDVIRESYIDKIADKVPVYNTYGPSETTVCCSYFKCTKDNVLSDGTYPIGKPVLEVSMEIVDEDHKPVKKGAIGEILIKGEGVSKGYLSPNKDSANFQMDENGIPEYFSGDLGYILPDGNFAFLYRKDQQVMILGKRVEPDEVNTWIEDYPGIENSIVVPFTDPSHLSYLTAYLVSKEPVDLDALKKFLALALTDFMIPEYFVQMPELPLNPNGKVDVKKLPVVLKGKRNIYE